MTEQEQSVWGAQRYMEGYRRGRADVIEELKDLLGLKDVPKLEALLAEGARDEALDDTRIHVQPKTVKVYRPVYMPETAGGESGARDEALDDIARDLFSELCEGDGTHSEQLDRALIRKHLERAARAEGARDEAPQGPPGGAMELPPGTYKPND